MFWNSDWESPASSTPMTNYGKLESFFTTVGYLNIRVLWPFAASTLQCSIQATCSLKHFASSTSVVSRLSSRWFIPGTDTVGSSLRCSPDFLLWLTGFYLPSSHLPVLQARRCGVQGKMSCREQRWARHCHFVFIVYCRGGQLREISW